MERQRDRLELSDGVELFYEYFESSKNNKTLVFINGMFQSVFDWYPLKDLLLEEYNILLYDLRGQGKTKIQCQEISLDRHVKDLVELISYFNLEKINIIGMSLGSAVALLFSNNYSELVDKMVLIGMGYGPRLEMIIDDWKNILELLGDFALFKFLLPCLFSDGFIKDHEQDISNILDALIERNNIESLLTQFSAITPYPNIKELLQGTQHPFIVVIGEEDALVSISSLKGLMQDIGKQDNILTIPGAGHSLAQESPKYLMEIIRNFI